MQVSLPQMHTPIAFLIFKRPDTTQQVFARIREAKPSKLLVVADGPRRDRPGEAEACTATRAIIDSVDWECEVLTNYSDINLGCQKRVSSGLDWVFRQVNEAIILEDDCLPDPSFFRFCEELLDRYQDDERIMAISGDNFQMGNSRTQASYYFSRYPHCWGWATWKRAWQHYDRDMKLWQIVKDEHWLDNLLQHPALIKYWTKRIQACYEGEINTWDYIWTLSCWMQNGLVILPNVNLVSNLGFCTGATHTGNADSPFSNMATLPIEFPLRHPPLVLRHHQADWFTHKEYYSPQGSITTRLLKKLEKSLALNS
jgi:hypothetical protein